MQNTVPQIEYGDFYKFVVSLGIALVLAAILVPWLFLREPFDLMVEASRLGQLTPTAQHILSLRQTYLLRLLPIVPWFSFSVLVMGVVTVVAGLTKWRKRQVLRDTSEELGVQKQEQELRNMTPEEENEKVEAEIQPAVNADAVQLVQDVSALKLRAVESAFYDKVGKCFDSSYRLLVNQILGTAEYDAILQPLRSTDPDVVIEIKYIRRGFKYAWLRESAMRLALAKELYDARLERQSVALLIVIFSVDEVFQQPDILNAREKTLFDLSQRGAHLRIEYVNEKEMSDMSCEDLTHLIFG
jgi:hypothetical protein